MRGALFAGLLVLTASIATATRKFREEPHPGEHGMHYPEREADKTCAEICAEDKGLDADTCVTECEVHTDLQTHHMNDGVDDFAEDEAYNEANGQGVEDHVEANHPVDVLDCAPEVDIDKPPALEDIDTKQDGVIDQEEAREWGHKACVTDEMTDQIFSQADKNVDHVIDKEEYDRTGEDTVHEEAIDDALEEHSEGDDEYNPVDTPPLEEFDDNNDGGLDEEEHKDAVQFEMERRGEGRYDDPEVPEQPTDEAFKKVDTDGNGKITGDEYTETPEDGGSDLGEELTEAAGADEDATDPDDLPRSGAEGAPAEAALLSKRFKVAQRDEAAFLRRFQIPQQKFTVPKQKHVAQKRSHQSFGHALVEVARRHHALRKQKSAPQRRAAFRRTHRHRHA